ncbi:KRAB-A domain-containing protein 2-like [Colias croceus]|uniref:KRAB-A domain-containing protein 2-like n=1 Tax=Colias crocea TaxID=72248 RepID=UPI001E28144D|nr:KRAB-A domain-containing protein 2-like [Colias croceus]
MADEMKKRFYKTITALIANKGKNNQLFASDQYLSLILKVKASKNKNTKKTPEEYQRLARYDVVKIGASEKLIIPVKNEGDPIIYYAHLDETFQIIHDCHISIGHGGRVRMMKELKLRYKNVTAELVTVYLNLCESCQKKKSLPKKGLVVKPIISNELNSRCQVDLVDMQSQSDGEFKFIMVYQDHLTKFVQLRCLKSKRAEEVAYHLLDIFTTFGAPSILQSDNGREFANKVVKEVCAMWPELKIVHGKPRHSQSQGSVERANQDVEKMLCTWLESNKTTKWSEGIRFIQFMKNRAYHAGINRSPYEAMFGCKPKVGLNNLPKDVIVELSTEEELESILKEDENQFDEEREAERNITDAVFNKDDEIESLNTDSQNKILDNLTGKPDNENKNQGNTSDPSNITQCVSDQEVVIALDKKKQNIANIRKLVGQSLQKQADKMLALSSLKYPAANRGDNVVVKIPDVDRAKADDRNIMAVIISQETEGMYKLGTKHGILNQLYTRNQFTVCKETFIKTDIIPQHEVTIRECAKKESHLGGQGFQHCNCTGECVSNKCKCKKSNLMCNSKCHKSLTCKNK